MSILIDDRAGSGPRSVKRQSRTTQTVYTKHYLGLNNYHPLNQCLDCQERFTQTFNQDGSHSWHCASGNLSHTCVSSLVRLSSADVSFVGNGASGPILIGVEVKSVEDLISSVGSGRLQEQITRGMLQDYNECWLLVHGIYRPSPKDNVSIQIFHEGSNTRRTGWYEINFGSRSVRYDYVQSFLYGPTLKSLGVQVITVPCMRSAASFIGAIYKSYSKPYDKHKSFRTLDRSQKPLKPPTMDDTSYLMLSIASDLPGMGFERAKAASERFDSIYDMITADLASWQAVNGIGKVLASSNFESIRRKKGKKKVKASENDSGTPNANIDVDMLNRI